MNRVPVWLAAAILLVSATPAAKVDQDRLWHHRNLGKAFYENPTTQKEAVEEFRKALDMDPASVRERINYGLALLKAGETKPAIAELEKAQKQDPSIPHTWFNLGIVAKKNGDYARGVQQLEQMIKLAPGEATAHYNLAVLYKLDGKPDQALKEFETAAKLNPNLAGPHFQLYNAYRQGARPADAARELKEFQEIKKRTAGAAIAEDMESSDYSEIYDPIDAAPNARNVSQPKREFRVPAGLDGIALIDRNGDGKLDFLGWSKDGVKLFENAAKPVAILPGVKDVISIAPGDYDNDGLPDLCVITKGGASIYHNEKGAFKKTEVALPPGDYRKAVWVDYDHDYDLDLLLLGADSKLLRNNGEAGFSDVTATFPFVKGNALDAVPFAISYETAARDLAVSYEDRTGVLYRDKLNGVFEAVPIDNLPKGAAPLDAIDFNHDSWIDLLAPGIALANKQGVFQASAVPPGVVTDAIEQISAAQTPPSNRWLRVRIIGVKNLKLAESATVEVKAGQLYRKKIYHGVPLFFDMQNYAEADTVRITWPNGLIQNEPKQKTNQSLSIKEAQRLSGSCPMIFTWNGRRYQFITDVLGVAPLGASSGDGHYFPVDHDEYVQIPGEALHPVNGRYEVRITEELREVSYLDKVQLMAVDHAPDTEIFTNDKFKSPPFPEFRLFGVKRRVYPVAALDHHGRDVRQTLLRRDLVYPDAFARDYSGIAESHHLDLDFGKAAPDGRAVLILNGWVDWADGSTFLRASQESKAGLVFPYLQVKNARGEWQTAIEDMGIPAGKPKTISVDLTGKFLSDSREIRIVTNLCVYWDEIFLSEETGAPAVRMTDLDAVSADLRFRGFSRPVIHPERKQPERFEYASWMPLSMWNPTPGLYTRYGDVKELVTAVDDRMVVMGSGDELRLLFPALAPPRDGWKRDFLLLVDGWAKDADANTAFSQSVEPLPFHKMSAYPYRADERFPDDEAHRKYLREYQTRPALKLIRPLVTAVPQALVPAEPALLPALVAGASREPLATVCNASSTRVEKSLDSAGTSACGTR